MDGPKPVCERLGVWLATSSRKQLPVTESESKVNENQRSIRDDASTEGHLTQVGENLTEARLPTHLMTMKATTKILPSGGDRVRKK
ncbi:hypothetical protein DPMN_184834 [Dreissena polymorpha]|uniref:Uncharacterized protein n=1 Tax=Dreissena polymorpha TaxID=45954 RepID=A0A9D4DJA1_DREPO|nr:hypothetical protein DPMN_184834 [Dreissena polymorpha]